MDILYFDCFAGISGDMTLSALVDAGADFGQLEGELKKLRLDGWELRLSEVSKHGIGASHVDVVVAEEAHGHDHGHKGLHLFHHHHHDAQAHVHRTMADIARLIDGSDITAGARELARRIFMRLAVAEAKIHGSTPDEVHFHEVGAVDSIIDIVGTAICIDMLSPDRICASVLHDGHGFVRCRHGTIPVPVPAVTEVLAARGATFVQLDIEGELMTPTGAAIIAELAGSFGPMPEMRIVRTGYGAGTKDFAIPNLLRVVRGEGDGTDGCAATGGERVAVVETNVDDTTPEILGYVMERLLEAGVRDVFFSPVYMKKCRPATCIHVLCDEADIPAVERILFTETSTIGLRKYSVARTCLPRRADTVATPYGDVRVKETVFDGRRRTAVEYDDARRIAREKGVALQEVYRAADSHV